jgi:hypothetical protein
VWYILVSPATVKANAASDGSSSGSCSRSFTLVGPVCGAMLLSAARREKKAHPKAQSHSGSDRRRLMVAGHWLQFGAKNWPSSCAA